MQISSLRDFSAQINLLYAVATEVIPEGCPCKGHNLHNRGCSVAESAAELHLREDGAAQRRHIPCCAICVVPAGLGSAWWALPRATGYTGGYADIVPAGLLSADKPSV